MIILPPMSRRPRGSPVKAPLQKLAPALLFDLLMTGLGLYALYETGEPVWLVVMLLIGMVPLLWVVAAAKREQRGERSRPIVEDARGRR